MIRRGLSGLLTALVLAMGVLVPLLDHASPPDATHIESGHDPVSCPTGHDHRICTQQGTLHLILAAPGAVLPPLADVDADAVAPPSAPVPALRLEGHPSRAPPRV